MVEVNITVSFIMMHNLDITPAFPVYHHRKASLHTIMVRDVHTHGIVFPQEVRLKRTDLYRSQW